MNDLINIDEYKSLKILFPKKLYGFTLILLILLIVLIYLLFSKYQYYYSGIGIVTDEGIIETKVNYTDSNKLLKNAGIIINKNKFSYKIKEVSVPLIENNIVYQNVTMNVNKYKSHKNTVTEFKIKYESKYGFEIIKELVFGKEL